MRRALNAVLLYLAAVLPQLPDLLLGILNQLAGIYVLLQYLLAPTVSPPHPTKSSVWPHPTQPPTSLCLPGQSGTASGTGFPYRYTYRPVAYTSSRISFAAESRCTPHKLPAIIQVIIYWPRHNITSKSSAPPSESPRP